MSPNPTDEVEMIALMEQQELEALVALAEDSYVPPNPPSDRYGSDEEDWESIFMECMMPGVATGPATQEMEIYEEVEDMEIG